MFNINEHMQQHLTVSVIVSFLTVICRAEIQQTTEEPKYWQAILGDICQLPSFPRATGDPHRYVECVQQNSLIGNRKDLGIWLLRECLPGYEFVALARRCETVRSVKKQQELCQSDNSSMYEFCPLKSNTKFLIEEIRGAPRQCECPNGEKNCVCPSPEILKPVIVSVNSKKARRPSKKTSPFQFAQYQSCPCPTGDPACTCVTKNNREEQILISLKCCVDPATTPCQCQSSHQENCRTTTTQQQYCPQRQPSVAQPQPCPLVQNGVQGAQYQGICSWMVDPLAVDPESQSHFLQCQPAPKSLFCGRWQRMPCAPSTVFDVQSQVCVWDPQSSLPTTLSPPPNSYVSTQAPHQTCSCAGGVQIGSCNQNYQCPGQSICQVGQNYGTQCTVCCYFRKKSSH